ncbi:hypothetical protein [Nocardioides sp. CFH 31398]|uniref:hypothetical protein n=1 Tax=Nocardioides sp. CFH 31398 TaxID=2919579 RepID=UPI001F05DDB7|nr:hypothetical protein [Nocardioides sp. CFH 31398]MCH1867060.1 hypothetical protein [Nocardioides sp. CFH 31398]
MPTGPKHLKLTQDENGDEWGEECRCMIGSDHDEDGEDPGQSLSVYDAAMIWGQSGDDTDTFGYSTDELNAALHDD